MSEKSFKCKNIQLLLLWAQYLCLSPWGLCIKVATHSFRTFPMELNNNCRVGACNLCLYSTHLALLCIMTFFFKQVHLISSEVLWCVFISLSKRFHLFFVILRTNQLFSFLIHFNIIFFSELERLWLEGLEIFLLADSLQPFLLTESSLVQSTAWY